VFVFEIQNEEDDDLEACVTFTFKNGEGTKADKTGGCWSQAFQCQHKGDGEGEGDGQNGAVVQGVTIHQTIRNQPCSYNIAAAVKVTTIVYIRFILFRGKSVHLNISLYISNHVMSFYCV
jgi:non-lysosomal glucosylceramidase